MIHCADCIYKNPTPEEYSKWCAECEDKQVLDRLKKAEAEVARLKKYEPQPCNCPRCNPDSAEKYYEVDGEVE